MCFPTVANGRCPCHKKYGQAAETRFGKPVICSVVQLHVIEYAVSVERSYTLCLPMQTSCLRRTNHER